GRPRALPSPLVRRASAPVSVRCAREAMRCAPAGVRCARGRRRAAREPIQRASALTSSLRMVAEPLDRAATAERLTAIAAAGGLSDRALARALDLASESPRPAEWRAFLSRSLLFLGSALMLAGVIFFFAYNWSELGRFAKFALLELAIAGAAAGAWQFGRTAVGEAAL